MVNIITGRINSGKTTRLIKLYNEIGQGDGFVLRKLYKENEYIGQEIVRLSTKESRPFAILKPYSDEKIEVAFTFFDYSFYKEGIEFGEKLIMELLENKSSPIFIDEIGPVELQGKGMDSVFRRIIESNVDVYVTIREKCVDNVIKYYDISEYNIECIV